MTNPTELPADSASDENGATKTGMSAPLHVPRRARKARVAAFVVAILALIGIGWSAALKAPERLELATISAWFQDSAEALTSTFDAELRRIVASSKALATRSAEEDTTGPYVDAKSVAEVIEAVARGLYVRMDQIHAASVRSLTEIATEVNRSSRSIDRSQRELMSRLDVLEERLARLEGHTAGLSNVTQPKPKEKPSAERPAPLSLQPSAPAPSSGGPQSTPAPVKRIDSWAVRDVVDGMAILAGPGGLIGVSSGDVVPGVGRVESITRRGGRWIVATSRGAITGP
jgi:hypothetical protein